MTRIDIPEELRNKLGPEMGDGIHWIDVKLHSGRTLKNLMVLDGKQIVFAQFKTGRDCGLSFSSRDIFLIRRRSIFPFWWQGLSRQSTCDKSACKTKASVDSRA